MPGLGRNLLLVNQAARNGVVPISGMDNPTLEANNFTRPLQGLGYDLYYLWLDRTDGSGVQELV